MSETRTLLATIFMSVGAGCTIGWGVTSHLQNEDALYAGIAACLVGLFLDR